MRWRVCLQQLEQQQRKLLRIFKREFQCFRIVLRVKQRKLEQQRKFLRGS